jgi:hypothetical protein
MGPIIMADLAEDLQFGHVDLALPTNHVKALS